MKLAGYFIIDQKTNKFVAVDFASGGYPYMTDSITAAYKFNKLDEAVGYHASSFKDYPNWKIVAIEIIATEVK